MKKSVIVVILVATFIGYWFFAPSRVCAPAAEVLNVGTQAGYPPYTFFENGEIVGFDIDVITEVARRLGKKIVLHDMPFNTLLPQLQLGSIEVIAAGMSPTPERAARALFTTPHLTGGSFVTVTRKPRKAPTTLEELSGVDVVVNDGFVADLYLSEHGVDARKLPEISDAFLALNSNRAEVFVTADTTLQPFFDLYGREQFDVQKLPGTQESIALIVSKSYPELHARIQELLKEMKEDGTLTAIKQKWHLADGEAQ